MESTTTLEAALAAWLAFMAELDVDMARFLLPPATETQIAAVEQEIGYRLPTDLRELYLFANGQAGRPDAAAALTTQSKETRWAPLFGNYEFLPIEQALEMWRVQKEIYSDPMFSEEDFSWSVRSGDPVDPKGWNRYWFVFAGREVNHYLVDTRPPAAGTPGQVVVHGADEWELQVLASSVTELMQQAAQRLDPQDATRYFYSDTGEFPQTVYFDMDWQKHIPTEQELHEEQAALEREHQDWLDRHPTFVQWQQEQLDLRQRRQDQFADWLGARGYSKAQSDEIVRISTGEFMGLMGGAFATGTQVVAMPEHVLKELESGEPEEQDKLYLLQTAALGLATGTVDESPATILRRREISYLYTDVMILYEEMAPQQRLVPAKEQLRLISQFHLEQEMISQTLYNGLDELLQELQSKVLDEPQYIGLNHDAMVSAEPIVEICESERCHKISLQPYLSL